MNLSRTFAGGPDRLCHAWRMRSCKAEFLGLGIHGEKSLNRWRWTYMMEIWYNRWKYMEIYGNIMEIWWTYWYNSGIMMENFEGGNIWHIECWMILQWVFGDCWGNKCEWLIMMLCSRRCMYSYGHLLAITNWLFQWDYTCYKWSYKYL